MSPGMGQGQKIGHPYICQYLRNPEMLDIKTMVAEENETDLMRQIRPQIGAKVKIKYIGIVKFLLQFF